MIKKAKKIECKEVEGETILFNEKKHEFFILNETGTFIWKKINGKNTEKQISSMLAKKYNKKEEKILADVKEILKKMISMKLIEK